MTFAASRWFSWAEVNERDDSMYLSFRWLMSQNPRPKKVIIWTATVHAAKELRTAGGAFAAL
jgi:erythromycin esterase-like protein